MPLELWCTMPRIMSLFIVYNNVPQHHLLANRMPFLMILMVCPRSVPFSLLRLQLTPLLRESRCFGWPKSWFTQFIWHSGPLIWESRWWGFAWWFGYIASSLWFVECKHEHFQRYSWRGCSLNMYHYSWGLALGQALSYELLGVSIISTPSVRVVDPHKLKAWVDTHFLLLFRNLHLPAMLI